MWTNLTGEQKFPTAVPEKYREPSSNGMLDVYFRIVFVRVFCIGIIAISALFVECSCGEVRSLVNVKQPETLSNGKPSETSEPIPRRVFKAEKHWKVVEEDEAIPKGLHVRINLATGKKEAKLLDESEISSQEKKYTPEELKAFVKNVKNEMENLTETKHLRNMSSIQKDFEDLHLTPVKSESHTIQELLLRFRNKSLSRMEQVQNVKEMEYLLHQYDVARDFVKMGGIRDLLAALNDTILRSDAALALGAALQGNPTVQTAALGAHGVHSMLVAIRNGCGPHCVFSLSTLLRQLPKAQKSFLQEGGPVVLSKVFSEGGSSEKMKVKIVTLLSDLMVERQNVMRTSEKKAVKNLYNEIDLVTNIVSAGFCELIPQLLSSRNEDIREKVLYALHALVDHCKLDKLVPHLESLRSHYRFRMNEESITEPDEYFEGLYKLADDLVKHITDVNHKHSEL